MIDEQAMSPTSLPIVAMSEEPALPPHPLFNIGITGSLPTKLPVVNITNTAASYNLREWDKVRQTWKQWDVSLPKFLKRAHAEPAVFCTNLSRGKRFPAAKLVLSARHQHIPHVTFLYFKNGKIVQVGAKSSTQSRLQAALLTTFIWKVFHRHVRLFEFAITNICVSGKLDTAVDLRELHGYMDEEGRAKYEPTLGENIDPFPALRGVVNPAAPKRKITVYSSGSFNYVGNKNALDCDEGHLYSAFIGENFQATSETVHRQKQRGRIQRERENISLNHTRHLELNLIEQSKRHQSGRREVLRLR